MNVVASWLEGIAYGCMADPDIALIGGPVPPRWEQPPPPLAALTADRSEASSAVWRRRSRFSTTAREASSLGPRTLLGANIAVRRDVLPRLGGFSAHLGKIRGTLLSGEDHELCRRVQAAGFKAALLPADGACRHWVPAESHAGLVIPVAGSSGPASPTRPSTPRSVAHEVGRSACRFHRSPHRVGRRPAARPPCSVDGSAGADSR